MKKLFAALALVALSVAGAQAGEVKSSTLSKMGYGNVPAMSDADGMAVRGKGLVIVGANAVNVGGAIAKGYKNTAINVQKAKASFAIVVIVGGGGGGHHN